LKTTKGLLHRLKTTGTFVNKRLKTGPEFSPTLQKFGIFFIADHRTQPNFATRYG